MDTVDNSGQKWGLTPVYIGSQAIPQAIPNITDMGNTHTSPQAQDTILTSTSETDSESVVAFNFGGSTGVLVILVSAVVVSFFLYQLCRCCMDGRCSKQQRPNNDNQGVNSAIIALALAIGQQQNVSQQQQHQQVQDHHCRIDQSRYFEYIRLLFYLNIGPLPRVSTED